MRGSVSGVMPAGGAAVGDAAGGVYPHLDEAAFASRAFVLDEGGGAARPSVAASVRASASAGSVGGGGLGGLGSVFGGGPRPTVFTEYAPRVFGWLRREVHHVSPQEYIASMEGASLANFSEVADCDQTALASTSPAPRPSHFLCVSGGTAFC